jgi:hypothetical protein
VGTRKSISTSCDAHMACWDRCSSRVVQFHQTVSNACHFIHQCMAGTEVILEDPIALSTVAVIYGLSINGCQSESPVKKCRSTVPATLKTPDYRPCKCT